MPALEERIRAAESKARLEDIYLPYKPKRRTKAQVARENGLEPLADALLGDPTLDPQETAAGYVNEQVPDAAAALEGARAILVERFAEDADLIGGLRERMWTRGQLVTKVREGKETDGAKYADYFDYSEPFTKLPSHRILAVFRGEKEEVLDVALEPDAEVDTARRGRHRLGAPDRGGRGRRATEGRAADRWLADCVRFAWRTRILMHLSVDIRVRLRTAAEEGAIGVFANNLRDLLLAAPAGSRATMGLDPGLRTGVKVAVVDATGKVVATDTIYPHEPRRAWDAALASLTKLALAHDVELVAIGNGTASRETEKLARELAARNPALGLVPVVVSEAGRVGVLGVGVRVGGAARDGRRAARRRLHRPAPAGPARGARQDRPQVDRRRAVPARPARVRAVPLARRRGGGLRERRRRRRQHGVGAAAAAGVGHHRVPRRADRRPPRQPTARSAPAPRSPTCRASAPRRSSSARASCASAAATTRSTSPACTPRPTRWCAASWPARRPTSASLIGNAPKLKSLPPREFVDERFGLPTVTDILAELEKPGRDPRPAFRTATFAEGVHKLSDLRPGMVLEGQVTNVAAFGAFVDVGVHQDGLVHVSAMSATFVSDPREVVKSGDVVRVKVLEVDEARKRISLTLRLDDEAKAAKPERGPRRDRPERGRTGGQQGAERGGDRRANRDRRDAGRSAAPSNSAMADALRRAGLSGK